METDIALEVGAIQIWGGVKASNHLTISHTVHLVMQLVLCM